MKSILFAAAVVVAMTSPAFAKHCPKDAKIIDQAMREAFELTEKQMAEVIRLRIMGVAYHKDGEHGEAIKALHEAIKILGVEPYKAM